MSLLKEVDAQKILSTSRMGLWRVEMEDGQPSRFFADAVMDDLLGVSGDISAEERFLFHKAHIHPDDQELFHEYSCKLSEIRTEIVYRYIHPVLGEMLVRCNGSRDTSIQQYMCVIGTHQDISDTTRLEQDKFAERRLAELNHTLRKEQLLREDYYQNLLDVQSCGVMVYTLPDHKIVHMNAEALRMYDLKSINDAQNYLGDVLSKVYYPEPDTLKNLCNLRNQDGSVDYECILYKDYANECHIVAKSKNFQTPNGERAVVTTFLDVSEMIVLRDALKKAEEVNQAKSTFLFAMSHDLRTPMNAIIGYAELMESHWDEKELTQSYLKKIKDASQFLLSLIGNILEMARIESGKETLHEELWNLSTLQDTLDLLDNEISRKQLHLHQDFCLQYPNVICDAMKVREIIMNLLSNAVKYTPDGGDIILHIDELPSAQNDYTILHIIIKDSGIGISPEYLPHLFEAFSKERDSSECGIIGSGLGLRIVKSFVDLMNGEIHVDSEPNKGTQFTVSIPLRIAPQNASDCLENRTSSDSEILKDIHILLAEDNPLNAEITQTILEDAHIQTDLAPDGAAALAMLQEAPAGYYDLILMDIQMPHLNGYQATQRIRALPDSRSQTPIIAMTANAFKEDRDAALASGMDDYIVKPVEIHAMLNTIASVLIHYRS